MCLIHKIGLVRVVLLVAIEYAQSLLLSERSLGAKVMYLNFEIPSTPIRSTSHIPKEELKR